jgi:hypothetical protein
LGDEPFWCRTGLGSGQSTVTDGARLEDGVELALVIVMGNLLDSSRLSLASMVMVSVG